MKMRGVSLAFTLAIGAGSLFGTGPAAAQEDFRAADLDRPIQVEDAYPVKYREWELETGSRGVWSKAQNQAEGSIEIKTGILLNTQAGLTLEGAWEDDGSGVAGGGLHVFHNFNRETWSWPALTGRVDVLTPGTGDVGRDDWGVSLLGIATRSLHRLRLHANAGYANEDEEFWRAGVAFDYPLGLFSRAILGDLYAEIPTDGGNDRVLAEFGTRWQLTNWSVLDVGLGTRLDEWADGRQPRARCRFLAGLRGARTDERAALSESEDRLMAGGAAGGHPR